MTRIVVTTPTGTVGSHVARALVRAGVRPVLLLRDPSKIGDDLRDLVDLVQGDQGDADAVTKATAGADALYWVAPPNDAPDPVAEYARFAGVAADAVRANGIPRVVLQSSIGAELRHGAGEIDGLARTEELLEATEASVCHLRCGFFFTNLLLQLENLKAEGAYKVVLPLDAPMAWVAPVDIAAVAAGRLLSPGWSGRVVQAVHGPADLTWEQAMEIAAEATGRPLRAERVTDDEMRAMLSGAGMGPGLVEAVLGMSTGMRDGFVPEQPRTAETTTPTTLASWAYDVLRPALAG